MKLEPHSWRILAQMTYPINGVSGKLIIREDDHVLYAEWIAYDHGYRCYSQKGSNAQVWSSFNASGTIAFGRCEVASEFAALVDLAR